MRLRTISVYAAIAFAIGLAGTGVLYMMDIGTGQLSWNTGTAPGRTHDDKALDASAIKNIEVQVSSADVTIVPSEDAQIHVVLKSNLSDEKLRERFEYRSEQNDDKLLVFLQGKGGNFGLNGDPNIHVDIRVPKQVFDKVEVRSASGDGHFESLNAKSLQVDSASGDIEIKSYKGTSLTATTKSGDILLHSIEADNTRVGVASGDVSVQGLTGQSFDTESASGDLDLTGIAAQIRAQVTSGDVDVTMKEVREDVDISVTSGKVQLHVPKSSAFSFDLQTRSGSLNSKIPDSNITSEDKHHQRGTVGSGGPSVRLNATSGDIRVVAE